MTVAVESASQFKLTNYGGLSTAGAGFVTRYLSASDDEESTPWRMSPSLFTIYKGFNLTTTDHGEVLIWEDDTFDDGKARFCRDVDGIWILLAGGQPDDCRSVDLIAYRDR